VNGPHIFPNGMHKGKSVTEVPTGFLKWYHAAAVDNRRNGHRNTPSDDLIDAVRQELESRYEAIRKSGRRSPPEKADNLERFLANLDWIARNTEWALVILKPIANDSPFSDAIDALQNSVTFADAMHRAVAKYQKEQKAQADAARRKERSTPEFIQKLSESLDRPTQLEATPKPVEPAKRPAWELTLDGNSESSVDLEETKLARRKRSEESSRGLNPTGRESRSGKVSKPPKKRSTKTTGRTDYEEDRCTFCEGSGIEPNTAGETCEKCGGSGRMS
jgi:hypothetical protein